MGQTGLNQRLIHLFLNALAHGLNLPSEVILTGASAGFLMGHVRPSLDVDFEIRLKGRRSLKAKAKLEEAVANASKLTGLSAQYSENIGGWSMISYLDYQKSARPYRRFGKLNVKIMAPEYWTIGKMARFFEMDVRDMIQIIRKKKIKPEPLIRLWAKALNSSSLSIELGQFRNHVIYFIRKYGKKIWGSSTDPDRLIMFFRRQITVQ